MTREAIAEKLKKARVEKKLTQKEVAERIGRSVKIVGHWETGYSQPDADTLSQLLKLYSIDANTFFEIEKAPASRQEPAISMEASNSILDGLIKAGIINDGPDLSDEDLAFLTHIVELLDTWFSRKR